MPPLPGMMTGIVESVDRTTGTCVIQALGTGTKQPGEPAKRNAGTAKYYGSPPPPFSFVDLIQTAPGVWRVSGVVADRRPVVNEDFATVYYSAPNVYCNEVWLVQVSGTAFLDQDAFSLGGEGVLSFGIDGASSNWVTKDDQTLLLTADLTYWYSARLTTSASTTRILECGLSNLAGTQAVWFENELPADQTRLKTTTGSTTTNVVPFSVTTNTWFIVDIVLSPGSYAALWIDGAGPFINTTNVPAAGADPSPFIYFASSTAGTRFALCDWVRLEVFNPAANPLRDLVLPESSLIG